MKEIAGHPAPLYNDAEDMETWEDDKMPVAVWSPPRSYIQP